MNQLISINGHALGVKEFHGQRVVTFRDVDECHERPAGTARKRFNDNRKHFIENEDFFKVSASEIRTHSIMSISVKATEDIVFLTESGYLMLVKSFTDDLAWQVQRALVNSYFRVKQGNDHREEIALLNAQARVLEAQAQLIEVQNATLPALPVDMQKFRRQVKEAMTGQHYIDLARQLGISRSYLCHILTTRGENARAPQRYIREIADILGLGE